MKSNTNLVTLVFLFISITCYSQSTNKVNLGAEVYTNFAGRIIEDDQLKAIEGPKLSASLRTVVTYRLKPNFALISGLSILNKGYTSDVTDLRWGLQHDGEGAFSSEAIFEDDASYAKVKQNYYFLSIPLNVRYGFGESLDKGWYLQTGVSPILYLFNLSRVITESDEGREDITYKEVINNVHKINLNINFGLGYTFLLKQKLQISVGPAMEFMPFNVVKNRAPTRNLYSFGLNTRFIVL